MKTSDPPSDAPGIIFGLWISKKSSLSKNSLNNLQTPAYILNTA